VYAKGGYPLGKDGSPSDGYFFAPNVALINYGRKYTNLFLKHHKIGADICGFYNNLTNYCGFMRLRNNIFAAAFDYLKREKGIKTQKRLAELMGVSEDTITRILKDRCEVTEDIITKLQTASGCIFNLQWLRGEDPIHMLVEDLNDGRVAHFIRQNGETDRHTDQSSLINALIAAKDQLIEELQEKYKTMEREKDARIAELKQLAEERLHRIAELRREIETQNESLKEYPFVHGVAEKNNQNQKRI